MRNRGKPQTYFDMKISSNFSPPIQSPRLRSFQLTLRASIVKHLQDATRAERQPGKLSEII